MLLVVGARRRIAGLVRPRRARTLRAAAARRPRLSRPRGAPGRDAGTGARCVRIVRSGALATVLALVGRNRGRGGGGAAGRPRPRGRARRWTGRRDPRRDAAWRTPAGRRWTGPRSAPRCSRRADPAVGSPDRRGRRHAPPRGPRGRAAAAGRTLPGRAAARAGNDRTGSRVRGARGGPGAPGPANGATVDGRPVRARRRLVQRALARPDARSRDAPPDTGSGINNVSIVLLGTFGAQRFLLTGDVEEGIDPILVSARASARRPAQGGPPREPRPRRRTRCSDAIRPDRGAGLGRRRQHVRASGAGNPCPAGGPGSRDVPHGSRRDPGRGARRACAQRADRARPVRRGNGLGTRDTRRRSRGRGPYLVARRGHIAGRSARTDPGRARHRGHV